MEREETAINSVLVKISIYRYNQCTLLFISLT
jgi:hypothetical protein